MNFLCVFPRSSTGTSVWIVSHFLEYKLVCIVDNSARISVSPMENLLLWSRIIHMIDALVFDIHSAVSDPGEGFDGVNDFN